MKKKMKIEFCGIFPPGHVFLQNQIWPQILRQFWNSNCFKNSNFYFFIMNRIWGSNWSIKEIIFTIFEFFRSKPCSVGFFRWPMWKSLFFILAYANWELQIEILKRKHIFFPWNFFCVYSKEFLVLKKNIEEFWACCAHTYRYFSSRRLKLCLFLDKIWMSLSVSLAFTIGFFFVEKL